MNKDKLTSEETKENTRITRVTDDGESEKHIKEMYEFADKAEFKSNLFFWILGIVIACIIMVSILFNLPFMKPKADVKPNKAVTKSTIDSSTTKIEPIKPVETSNKIYEYLNIETNRTSLLKQSIDLNKGSQKGVTIYLLSELLRLNAIAIPASTSSVQQLMKDLTSMEWKKNTDFTKLEKGDVCFTTDMPEKPGVPSHAYIFMGWSEEGKTDYANICDGQVEEYGNILHKRNISITTTHKDKFSFFLRK